MDLTRAYVVAYTDGLHNCHKYLVSLVLQPMATEQHMLELKLIHVEQ